MKLCFDPFDPIWTPPKVSAKYLKTGLADLHETLSLLRPLYRSCFKIESWRIGHSLLPW